MKISTLVLLFLFCTTCVLANEKASTPPSESQLSSEGDAAEEPHDVQAMNTVDCLALSSEEKAELLESLPRYGIVIMLLLLCATFMIAYFFHQWHFTYIHEAGAALLMGVAVAWFISLSNGCAAAVLVEVIRFNKEIFFLMLLPPIIFEAGYNMKRRHFFSNLGGIFMYAFVGTAVSNIVIGLLVWMIGKAGWVRSPFTFLESFVFGALISATDPVTVLAIFQEMRCDLNLYSMVFGESVLNDAVAIVLYRTFNTFNPAHCDPLDGSCDVDAGRVFGAIWYFIKVFGGSLLIGGAFALLAAKMFKHMKLRNPDLEHLESALTFPFPYMAWMLADGMGLSGIISILACGIVMAHYMFNNLSESTQIFTRKFYKMFAMLAETFVFIYMGMAMFSVPQAFQHINFIVLSIVIVLVSRTFNIFPNTYVVNLFRKRENKIDARFQFVMWFSGLRGAIAFALALEASEDFAATGAGTVMLTATLFIVLFTVLVIGGSTATLLKKLSVQQPEGGQDTPEEQRQAIQEMGKSSLRLLHFDRYYLKPFFTHRARPNTTNSTDTGHFELQAVDDEQL